MNEDRPPAGLTQLPDLKVPRSRRRWLSALIRRLPTVGPALLVVVVVLVFVASRIYLPIYAYQPGSAQSVLPLLQVPHGRAHRVAGRILLVDVEVVQVSLLDYLPDRMSSDMTLNSVAALVGPQVPASQLQAQGKLEMEQSQDDARAAAFTQLRMQMSEHDAGALVTAVRSGTAAAGELSVGEVITAVDKTSTPDLGTFVNALQAFRPGDEVSLMVDTVDASGSVTSQVARTVRLGSDGKGRPLLGGLFTTQQDFTFPIAVGMDAEGIGGPSAGLAMTLGIISTLTGDDLTDGRTVAATGTIDPAGDVGDVGGVEQKTIAVSRAGATVFFVPPQELAVAKAHAGPHLRVYAVSSLSQALSVLAHLGGHVP